MKLFRHRLLINALGVALTAGAATMPQSGFAKNKRQEQADLRRMAMETLNRLYRAQPNSRVFIRRSYGYAVFRNFGMKILVLGGGKGKGVAINRRTGKATYMRMLELQAGLGMGIKKFSLVWVFRTRAAFDLFVTQGWQIGGQATAATKSNTAGGAAAGAISISNDVWLYQMTDKGLALELTAKGTKYYRDKDLN